MEEKDLLSHRYSLLFPSVEESVDTYQKVDILCSSRKLSFERRNRKQKLITDACLDVIKHFAERHLQENRDICETERGAGGSPIAHAGIAIRMLQGPSRPVSDDVMVTLVVDCSAPSDRGPD
ncbi:hypothetical protein NPIL_190791 [Nephila pilipes]|uniref:Uncharacterized protein n=1 Tax=Nephila pilipes TaxID=299642 RepID=A0A8X6UK62_NEPPI|nr:hypothetical protein NPIL_190791 [Nephila pilipes]